MKIRGSETSRERGAFRPLDVAAIICVLGVLGVLGFVGMGRFREGSARSLCKKNLLQLGNALQLYARENNDRLPDCTPANPRYAGPVWPWDLNSNLAKDLETKGALRDHFYCPANPEMNDDKHWAFSGSEAPIRVVGYGMLFPGIRQVSSRLWRRDLKSGKPAEAELMFDATASTGEDYTLIQGGLTDRSNHLRGKRPLGGNILFVDQHVDWRDFEKMEVRITTRGVGGPIDWRF
jgi:hypothetical protein